jgi:hypothetical protein
MCVCHSFAKGAVHTQGLSFVTTKNQHTSSAWFLFGLDVKSLDDLM